MSVYLHLSLDYSKGEASLHNTSVEIKNRFHSDKNLSNKHLVLKKREVKLIYMFVLYYCTSPYWHFQVHDGIHDQCDNKNNIC